MDRIRKMFANQPLRIEIAHRDREVPVGGKTTGGLGQPRRILEVNRLRHDNDPVPWELLDDTLPELLVNRVKITEISAAVQNDAAVGRNIARIAAAEIEHACAACDLVSGAAEQRFRSQLDEPFADIEVNRVVRVQARKSVV